MSTFFLCGEHNGPKDRTTCRDLAGLLILSDLRTPLTDVLASEMVQQDPDDSPPDEYDLLKRHHFEVLQKLEPGENPYDKAVEYERAEALAWCAFAAENGQLCGDCPLLALLPEATQ